MIVPKHMTCLGDKMIKKSKIADIMSFEKERLMDLNTKSKVGLPSGVNGISSIQFWNIHTLPP